MYAGVQSTVSSQYAVMQSLCAVVQGKGGKVRAFISGRVPLSPLDVCLMYV